MIIFLEIENPSQKHLLLYKQQHIIAVKDVIFMVKDAKMTLPVKMPIAMGSLTSDEFYVEIKRGYDDCVTGRVEPAEQVFQKIESEFGL